MILYCNTLKSSKLNDCTYNINFTIFKINCNLITISQPNLIYYVIVYKDKFVNNIVPFFVIKKCAIVLIKMNSFLQYF